MKTKILADFHICSSVPFSLHYETLFCVDDFWNFLWLYSSENCKAIWAEKMRQVVQKKSQEGG